MPDGVTGSCVVPWNETTMLVTGGQENGTYFVNTDTETVTPGPAMQNARTYHACQEFLFQGQPYIIVGGGYDENSTEVLDKNNVGQGWTEGKQK